MNVSVNKGKIELNSLEIRALHKAMAISRQISKLAGALDDKRLEKTAAEAMAQIFGLLADLGVEPWPQAEDETEPKQKE